MIRVNLIGVPRKKASRGLAVSVEQWVTAACSLILIAGAAGVGWWYWSLTSEAARLETDLASARQEAARLQPVIREVAEFDQRRAQLQQRVALIQQLRGGQSVPVQLLDLVSRSLPDMLWLTRMDQQGNEVTFEGRSTTLIALSDFVGNLGAAAFLEKPVEIVSSQVEPAGTPGSTTGPTVDVIQFTVKARMAEAVRPAPPSTPGGAVATPVRTAPGGKP